jgi:hypothetical protein
MFDIIIKNGTIYDGTLSESFVSDIGIIGNKISAIGKLPEIANKTIDAENYIVTPGFVDIHTHCDMAFKRTILKKYPDAVPEECKRNHNLLYQGITTVVTGNCGLGYSNTKFWLDIVDSINFSANVFHLITYGIVREDITKLKLTTVKMGYRLSVVLPQFRFSFFSYEFVLNPIRFKETFKMKGFEDDTLFHILEIFYKKAENAEFKKDLFLRRKKFHFEKE